MSGVNLALFSKKNSEMNFLELTPVANYNHEEQGEGLVNVLVPRFNDKVFGKLLQPRIKNKYIKANLDEIGSGAWLLIDGKRKVMDIADELSDKFGEKIEPAYNRVALFMSQLYQNGFIHFLETKKENKNG